jgi:hypothetical protein
MSTFGRATQSRSVIGKKKLKTCSSRWIIPCTPQCVAVARDCLPNIEAGGQTGGPPGGATAPRTEAGGQTTTPDGPTASRRRAAAQPCTPPAVTVVEAVVMTRRTAATSRCSMCCERRTTSPHRWQAGTSNLLLHESRAPLCIFFLIKINEFMCHAKNTMDRFIDISNNSSSISLVPKAVL